MQGCRGKCFVWAAGSGLWTLALRPVEPRVLSKGGVPGSTRVYTLGDDGRTLTETATYFGDGGVPIVRTHYFHRTE